MEPEAGWDHEWHELHERRDGILREEESCNSIDSLI